MAASKNNSIKRFLKNLIWDSLALFSALLMTVFIKYGHHFELFSPYYIPLTFYTLIHIFISIMLGKYEYKEKIGFYKAIDKYLKAWVLTSGLFLLIAFLLDIKSLNFITIIFYFIVFFLFEVILLIFRYSFRRSINFDVLREDEHREIINIGVNAEEDVPESIVQTPVVGLNQIYNKEVRELIEKYSGKKQPRRLLLFTHSIFNMLPYLDKSFEQIVNLSKINRVRFINKFHETANIKLSNNGLYFVCTETLDQRRNRFMKTYTRILGYPIWIFDFFIHRVSPRLPYIRKAYFSLWNHWVKPISYAESLGRLYSCGFELVEEKVIENKYWFVMRKVKVPIMSDVATYGLLIKLKRYGKGGKPIQVFKFRTMHPFSEFLQELVMQRNKLAEGGKFKNDFRVSNWGRFLRKTWMDELPMIANFLRGDLKLVGVRPLSKQYLSLYPEEFQKKRFKVKPGLIPPFYADMPKTLEEIISSEDKYIDAFFKHGFATDWKYFWKAFWNIVVKQKRSN